MIFNRIIFLLLVLMSLNVNAQTQPQSFEQNNKTQPYKFDEYGKISSQQLKIKLSDFFNKPMEENFAAGYIVVYAPNRKKLNSRVDVFRRFLYLKSRGAFFDVPLDFTFIDVKSDEERTEFWVIPKGAEPPTFKNQEK